jgi:hypothetical protein
LASRTTLPANLTDGKGRTLHITLADQSRIKLFGAVVANDSIIGRALVNPERPSIGRVGVPRSEVQKVPIERFSPEKTALSVLAAYTGLRLFAMWYLSGRPAFGAERRPGLSGWAEGAG